jgi:hypothetical protein
VDRSRIVVIMRDQGSVRLISTCVSPTAHQAPLIRALIGGAQPIMADGPLSPTLYKEVGAGGSNYEVRREPHTPPTHLPI